MRPSGPVPDGVPAVAADLLASGRSHFVPDGVLDRTLDAAYAAARRFFALEEGERALCALPFGCGQRPFGREHSGDAARPDEFDCFATSDRTRAQGEQLPVPAARDLHAAMMAVFDAMLPIAARVVTELAASLAGHIAKGLGEGLRRWSVLEIHQARPLAANALINATHEDGHLLTFAHATAPGLELAVEGGFVPARHDAVSVLPGSALTLLSGGAVEPLHHRVLARPKPRPRLSLLLFVDLDPRLCSPWQTQTGCTLADIAAHVLGNSARFGTDGFVLE